MKINDIKKDYKIFLDKIINTEDEVYTAKELYELCQKNNIKATYAMVKSYAKRVYKYFIVKSTLYFGTVKNINKLKKIVGGNNET